MRRIAAAVAAVLGTACLALFPMAGASSQSVNPLVIYDSYGIGQGVVATFAVKPSIFDPLAQGGFLYTQSSVSSLGGGSAYSIGSQAFPGTFAIGALGCGGLPGGTFVQALYPPTEDCKKKQESTIYKRPSYVDPKTNNPTIEKALKDAHTEEVINSVLDKTSFDFTHILAQDDLGYSLGLAETLQYSLAGADGVPILRVKDFDVTSTSRAGESLISHDTVVRARDVDLFNGGISIGTITSRASTTSDGVEATAKAVLVFSDVTVRIDGKDRRAEITQDGITVTDPALSKEQRTAASEQVEEGLLRGGVKISVASPDEITEGSNGEASIGGLTIAFSGTLPGVTVPSELTPVLGAILGAVPTKCLSDFGAALPLCFGAGILPGGGSSFPLTLQIAGANAFSAGTSGPSGITIDDPRECCLGSTGGGDPASSVDQGFTPGTPGSVTTTTGANDRQPFVQGGPRTGLVARLPAAALLWLAALFLCVALGVGLGPAIRDAGRG